jgi:hypothetical protein
MWKWLAKNKTDLFAIKKYTQNDLVEINASNIFDLDIE